MPLKRLCLVIPSLQAGGMERAMSELAAFFCLQEDIEVHLVLYGKTAEVFYSVPQNLKIHRPVHSLNERFRTFHTLKRLIYLRKTVKEIRPDSILSFGEIWNSFVLVSLSGLRFPVFISDRCSPARTYNMIHSLLRKILYPLATGIICQTQKAKEIYEHQFNLKNTTVIGNPIRSISNEMKTEKENIVLMVSRLIRSKNQDKLIEIFLDIGISDWKLVLVGYDHLGQNYSQKLREIILRNKAEEKVILTGKQENVDLFYKKSRIFAFTSSSEGFPNAIGEAMSAGIPVVAFDCIAGPSEMIRNDYNGFLVPVHDSVAFREKLKLLMQDDDLRQKFGTRAKEDIGIFSPETICNRYLSFILNPRIKK